MSDTRGRILDVALELFSEHGFEGTTLQQIADRLGFTKAALYYHFRSKDDLLEALVMPVLTDLDGLLDVVEMSPGVRSPRRVFVERYVDYLLRHRRVIGYVSQDLACVAHPAIASGHRERRARMEGALADGELDFREQVRVGMAFGGIQAVIATHPGADTAELRDALLDAASSLLRLRRGGQPAARPHPRGRLRVDQAGGGPVIDRDGQLEANLSIGVTGGSPQGRVHAKR
jgi:AcrR family transcriptional regulator